MSKIVYLFDETTKEFNGSWECQESPLEPGIHITPTHSTEIAAPSFNSETETCVWNGSGWAVSAIPVPEIKSVPIADIYTPTKEELLAQLAALQAQIQAL